MGKANMKGEVEGPLSAWNLIYGNSFPSPILGEGKGGISPSDKALSLAELQFFV